MTTVWRLDHTDTHINSLSLRYERPPIYPRNDGLPELETWEAPQVWYEPLDFRVSKSLVNFPRWTGITPVCDAHAMSIVQPLISEHVEFLPLDFRAPVGDGSLYSEQALQLLEGKSYHAINVLTTLDCMDYERSEITYFESTGGIFRIPKMVLKADCVGDAPIFKLPIRNRVRTYVSDEFKQLVEANNLTGLEFRKIRIG